MLRFTRVHDQPLDAAQAARAVRLRLTYDERVKSRLATMSADGQAVAILLADHRRGSALRDGAVLAGDDGVLAIIEAAPQALARVTAESPLALLRAVYHLANRHVPAQLAADHALIERDPVLERMLISLGATVEHVERPFDPEPGAYDGHGHSHAHHGEADDVSATLGEQLSIEAHRARRPR
jgi:urease accessory protein